MIKIVAGQEMGRLERLAFAKYGEHWAALFMEQAGAKVAAQTLKVLQSLCAGKQPTSTLQVFLMTGRGNNAGDAYVCGRLLAAAGWVVTALQVDTPAAMGPLCRRQYEAFTAAGGRTLDGEAACALPPGSRGVVVDGLMGTGLRGELPAAYQALINAVRESRLPVIAIDLPSGVHADTGVAAGHQGAVVQASYTVSLGLPKRGLFLEQAWDYVGKLEHADFGLQAEFLAEAKAEAYLLTADDLPAKLPKLRPLRHKYEAGSVLVWAGSSSMQGAAVLTCSAALRSGCGMVFHCAAGSSDGGSQEGLQAAPRSGLQHHGSPDAGTRSAAMPVEVIHFPSAPAYASSPDAGAWLTRVAKMKACVVGPGLGRSPELAQQLRQLLPQVKVPMVLDADALSLFAEEPWPLNAPVVMTPHLGELQRLLGRTSPLQADAELVRACQTFADTHRLSLVVKGAVSMLFHPGTPARFSHFGNPGMATAGSGDVLAGIIAALLAQGLEPLNAAQLGLGLHGLAGRYAQNEKSAYSLIASDLVAQLPNAFKELLAQES